MKFSIATLALIASSASAAGIAACTENSDGSGPYNVNATRQCCENVNPAGTFLQGKYSETYHDCRTHITNGNGIDQEAFSVCCGDRGYGSTAQ